PADDPGEQFAEAYIRIGVCTATGWHTCCELRITQGREPAGDATHDKEQHHARPALEAGLAHTAETTRTDDGCDTEEGEVAYGEVPAQHMPTVYLAFGGGGAVQ